MPTVRMYGRILPDAFHVSVGYDPTINWKWEETNQELRFHYTIKDSACEISCDLAEWKSDYVTEIYKRGYDILRATTDLVAFSTGNPLHVHLDRFVAPDGKETHLAVMNPDLVGLCTAFSLGKDPSCNNGSFDRIMGIVLSDPTLFLALSDLIRAITHHDHITTGCARALDGIRLMVWGQDTTTSNEAKASWEKLRTTLRVSEPYLKLITDNSKGSRHGSRNFIPGTVTNEVAKRSWVVMNRFLELPKRGIQELPVAEFPLL
jgi:hypothetical protein